MSRSTQIMGLSNKAFTFLSNNGKRTPLSTCPTCGHSSGGILIKEVYASAEEYGMFDDGPKLNKYLLDDGTWVKEIVQACPWSSGPMIFLCLENEKGQKLFEWDWNFINNC